MKINICLILSGLIINCALAQTTPPEHQWNATLKAIDETGNPVAGAKIQIGYDMSTNVIVGLTDTNGIFTASHTGHSVDLSFYAEKPGYYPFRVQYHMGFNYTPAKWNPTQIILLNRKINPVPMYAKHVEGGPPVFNKPVGYDLMVGDWVGTFGKGINADIVFTGELNQKAKNDFDYKLTISFPNQADGIQEFSASVYYLGSKGSELRSSEEAPANDYQSQVIRTMSRHPDTGTKEDINNPDRNYYFRVRTKVDDRGNIASAHYGKIYGDFMTFSYYFNPTPNDRNVEFDPKQNLMTNLKPGEGVSEP